MAAPNRDTPSLRAALPQLAKQVALAADQAFASPSLAATLHATFRIRTLR